MWHLELVAAAAWVFCFWLKPGSTTINFTYDTLNRLTSKTPPSPATTVTYSYDLNNRLLGVSDGSAAIVAAVPPTAPSVQYVTTATYDAMNRPTGFSWNPAASATAPPAGSVSFGHTYNKVNQRSGQTGTDNTWFNYPAATPSTVSYTANALNQYTAVGAVTPSYDGNGNLTSDGTFTLGYDSENRLTSAVGAGNTVAYGYDAQARRKSKTVNGTTTVFVTDAANREVLEYDGSSGAVLRWYAYGPGSNDALNQMNVAANTRSILVPDILGSVIGTYDSSSGALSKVGYLPYGKSATSPGPFGFTGQRFDAESGGLYYYRARHYSSAWGRFVQPDPIGYSGGANLYAYVGNDPLNATDPSGEIAPWLAAAVLGAVVGGGIDLTIQLIQNGGQFNQVDWTSVGVSAVVGAGLSGLAPGGFLLGRGGVKAAEYGYTQSPGLLNQTTTRFGWSYNAATDLEQLSVRFGRTHFDIPGTSIVPGANTARDALGSGILAGGILGGPTPAQGAPMNLETSEPQSPQAPSPDVGNPGK